MTVDGKYPKYSLTTLRYREPRRSKKKILNEKTTSNNGNVDDEEQNKKTRKTGFYDCMSW